MTRRMLPSKREALEQSKASLDFYADAAGVDRTPFTITMAPKREYKPKPRKALERTVLADCLKYLRSHPRVVFARRRQSGMFRALHSDALIRVGTVGEPDVDGMLRDGRYFAVEMKREGENPSPDQWARIHRINEHGGVAWVAWSIEDCRIVLDDLKC